MVNIYIADDHAMLRDGLKSIVDGVKDMVVVGETDNAKNIIRDLRSLNVDVLLLDVSMPGPSFMDTLSHLTDKNRAGNKIKILILSAHPEEQYAIRAIKSGASGYLTKDESPDKLIDAIRLIHKGRRYISNSLAEMMAEEVIQGDKSNALSNREYQILIMLGKGMAVKEIAHSLSLSPKTISTYRVRLFKKLNFKTNADLIYYVLEKN